MPRTRPGGRRGRAAGREERGHHPGRGHPRSQGSRVTITGGGAPGAGRRRGEGHAPPPRPPAPAPPWTRGRRSPQRGPRAGTRAEPTEPAGTPQVQTSPAGRTAHCAGAARANRRSQRKGRSLRGSQPAPAHSSGLSASSFQSPSGARVCARARARAHAPAPCPHRHRVPHGARRRERGWGACPPQTGEGSESAGQALKLGSAAPPSVGAAR